MNANVCIDFYPLFCGHMPRLLPHILLPTNVNVQCLYGCREKPY